MTPIRIAAAGASMAAALAAFAAPPPAPKPEGVTTTSAAPGTIADLRAAGAFVSVALPRVSGGKREIVVLARTEPRPSSTPKKATEACGPSPDRDPSGDGRKPLRLLRWSTGSPSVLAVLREDLDAAIEALDAVDLDGDGSDEILLFRPGAIEALARGGDGAFSGSTRPVVQDPALEVETRARIFRSPLLDEEKLLRYALAGAYRTYGAAADAGEWGVRSSLPLPTEARVSAERITVLSRSVVPVGRRADGTLVLATAPEQVGKERIRFWRLEPDAADGAEAVECWCALPGQEQLVDWGYEILGGRPVLIATTTRADKISLLGEKKLRIFPMEPDRTRRGAAPLAAFDTGLNLW